ncbi:MAG: hypothetical protein U1A78_02395 [Polyangia bacterium]
MAPRKTYYPSKTFDDDFAAFVEMAVTHNWAFPGLTPAALKAQVKAQRAERAQHDALELSYLREHERFGVAQAERYALFSSILNAARGSFRDNKEILAQLARFKSPRGGRKKGGAAPDKPAPDADKPEPAGE